MVIGERDWQAAAEHIGCEIAALKAVAEVESEGRSFLPDGRPPILYEAHIFDRLTRGLFRGRQDRFGVSLSERNWNRSLYGAAGAHQYRRLEDAMRLDERSAVFACSWGTFQIMGFNFASLGFRDVDTFREFMRQTDTPEDHLDLFVRFIMLNGLDDELRRRDWAGFARQYNGPQFRQNQYDTKIEAAYYRLVSEGV